MGWARTTGGNNASSSGTVPSVAYTVNNTSGSGLVCLINYIVAQATLPSGDVTVNDSTNGNWSKGNSGWLTVVAGALYLIWALFTSQTTQTVPAKYQSALQVTTREQVVPTY